MRTFRFTAFLSVSTVSFLLSGCADSPSANDPEPPVGTAESAVINGKNEVEGFNISILGGPPVFVYLSPGIVKMERAPLPVPGNPSIPPADSAYKYACTATMISQTSFLTAKHCVCPSQAMSPFSACNPADLTKYAYRFSQGQWLGKATSVTLQPDLVVPPTNSKQVQDVAMVKVDTAFPVTNTRTLYAGSRESLFGKTVRCYGYGPAVSTYDYPNGNYPSGTELGVRRSAELPVVDPLTILPAADIKTNATYLKANTTLHQQVTRGDSGGPCLYNMNGRDTIVGSFSFGSASSMPTEQVDAATAALESAAAISEWVAQQAFGRTNLFGNSVLTSAVQGSYIVPGAGDTDGNPDLIELYTDKITVRRGNGAGGYGAPISSPFTNTGWDTSFASFEDLNNDGVLDFVYLSENAIYTRINTNGTFGPVVWNPLPSSPIPAGGKWNTYARTARVDNGSSPDFIYIDNTSIYTLLGASPSGTFQAASQMKKVLHSSTSNWSQNTWVGKLDADTLDDIVHVEPTRIIYRRGGGDGTFGTPVYTTFANAAPSPYTSWDQSARVGYFNNDDILDFAFVGDTEVIVRLGDGAGSFGAPVQTNFEWSNQWASYGQFVDVNGDGCEDIAMITDKDIWLRRSNCKGGFAPMTSYHFASPYAQGWPNVEHATLSFASSFQHLDFFTVGGELNDNLVVRPFTGSLTAFSQHVDPSAETDETEAPVARPREGIQRNRPSRAKPMSRMSERSWFEAPHLR